MSKRQSNALTVGKSEHQCGECKGEMVIRKHAEITEKLRRQYYYFTQWDYCKRCNKVYFDEKYRKVGERGAQLDEVRRQESFLASL